MEEISLKSLFNYYLERIKIIGICTLIFFLASIVFTAINRPKYISESTITITGDLNQAKTLSTNYAPQVTNNTILQTVISNLGLKTTVKNLKENITSESDASSDSIQITVMNTNSQEAMEINAELNRVYVEYIKNVYGNEKIAITADATITGGGIVKKYAKQIVTIAAVGFALGIIYIFIKFYFDSSVKSEDDINSLKLEIYGVIPNDNKLDTYKESYKNVISNITTKSLEADKKVILLTSADELSSRNETVYDLANEYAALNKKVLVIDADLKNNKQSELFKLKATKGYVDLINSKSAKIESFITNTKNKLIDVIVNGSTTLNEVEILSSKRNEEVLNKLKEKYDVIILDCPPAIGTNGTDVLSRYATSNLLVVSNGITKINDIKDVIDKHDIKLNGVIVNKANTKLNNYSIHYTKNYYNK